MYYMNVYMFIILYNRKYTLLFIVLCILYYKLDVNNKNCYNYDPIVNNLTCII